MEQPRYDLPLVRTKLFIGQTHRNLVGRKRLLAILNQSNYPLTVIIAGAGWGKSTLLSQWANSEPQPVAWISLDQSDNEPIRFLNYLLAALQTVDPLIGNTLLSSLNSPQLIEPELLLTRILNELAVRSQTDPTEKLVLILDDVNVLTAPEILTIVTQLIEQLPPNVRLIIASRSEPALPLGRWRASGQLCEITTNDLRFNNNEASEFFQNSLPLAINQATLEILNKRTEGWIAGLHLAGLAAQTQPNLDRFVNDFAGSHRYILDYLVQDVIEQQPDHIKEFLYATALLERFCSPLAEAMYPNTTTQPTRMVIDYLVRQQLFLVSLDNDNYWYRYHHLFADMLRFHIQQTAPHQIPELHRRASEWYKKHNLLEDAMYHSLAAQDHDQAIHIIVEHGRSLLMRGAAKTVQGWLQNISRSVIYAHAHLAIIQAWVDTVIIRPNEIEQLLSSAEHYLYQVPEPERKRLRDEILVIRAIMPRFTEAIHYSMERSQAVLEQLDPTDVTLQGIIAGNLTVVHTLLGNLTQASEAAALARRMNQASGNIFAALLAIADQAILDSLAGQLYTAAETFNQGIRLAEQQGWNHDPAYGNLHIGIANIYYEWNQLDSALEYSKTGIQIASSAGYSDITTDGFIVQICILMAQSKYQQAEDLLQNAMQIAERNQVDRFIYRVQAYQVKLALRQGLTNKAQQLLPAITLDSRPDPEYLIEYLTHVAVAVSQDDWKRAQHHINTLNTIIGERISARIELALWQALIHWRRGVKRDALETIESILESAIIGGYKRIFLDVGGGMYPLMRACQAHTEHRTYVQNICLDLEAEYAEATINYQSTEKEILSEREIEVLKWLEIGYTNQAIAEQLTISIGTVKRHLSNIYTKLDATSRTEAIAKAHEKQII